MWQWMGNMFYRKQPINAIEAMTYHELKMWNFWHELMVKEEIKAVTKNA